MLSPVMPKTCETIADALGFTINHEQYVRLIEEKGLLHTFMIKKTPPLFPKIEKELLKSEPPTTSAETKETKKTPSDKEGLITIDEFFRTKLKIGTILEAEAVPKSDRLLKLKVDLGEAEPRQIIAGIRAYYEPETLIDTQVCIVANLKPAKIMGHLSEGMLLAAKDEGGLALIRPEKRKKSGTPVG